VAAERKTDAQVLTLDNQVNKLVRIRRLGPYLSQRRIRFKARSPGAALLVDQLKDFPVGDFDDGPDGAEMMIRGLLYLQGQAQAEAAPMVLRSA
jgi:hypothetical protein